MEPKKIQRYRTEAPEATISNHKNKPAQIDAEAMTLKLRLLRIEESKE